MIQYKLLKKEKVRRASPFSFGKHLQKKFLYNRI